MANYLTNDIELTAIADAIRTKGGTTADLTYPTDFITAIEAIETSPETQTKTINPNESVQTVEPDSGKLLSAVTVTAISSNYVGSNIPVDPTPTANGKTVSIPSGYYSTAISQDVSTATQATPAISVSAAGVITASATQTAGYVAAGTKSSTFNLTTQAAKTVSPTESAQTAVSSGYYTTGAITVGAVSSDYVGSNIARKSSTDLAASGSVVTVPAGYYSTQATKAVAAGTAGTPTATKGTVSNHAISITPSVTNTAGYIATATKTGTAVSVTASELVSGTLTITDNGSFDVTNYASASVDVGVAMPSFTYTGTYETVDDGDGNWRIKFKTSGTFKITSTHGRNVLYDIFCVGGGGGGKSHESNSYWGCAGGGGGYTKTVENVALSVNTSYTVTIGAGGAVDGAGGTSSFGSFASASGGQQGWAHGTPGAGGSGGGGGSNNGKAGNGGSNGGNGGAGGGTAGAGQGTTTREFGESSGTLYAGGGGGGTSSTTASNRGSGGSGGGGQGAYANGASSAGSTNYGGGGGGSSAKNGSAAYAASKGGSGIVVLRNHR